MCKVEPTKEEYDTLQCKLATLEAELRNAHNLLEPPAKVSWWRRFWGLGTKGSMVLSLIMMVLMVGIASGKEFVSVWQKMKEVEKGIYVMGYYNGMLYGSIVRDLYPKKTKEFFDVIHSWTYWQQRAIIDKYVQDNPYKWNEDFGYIVFEAYKDAYEKGGHSLNR